jgi:hypothetical protein
VTGVERVVRRVLREDDRLGQRRPNEMASALATLDATLDSARRLRLARDSFAARAAICALQSAIAEPLVSDAHVARALDEIRRLAGPSQRAAQAAVGAVRRCRELARRHAVRPRRRAHELLRKRRHARRPRGRRPAAGDRVGQTCSTPGTRRRPRRAR